MGTMKKFGYLSALASFGLLALVAGLSGAFSVAIGDLGTFLTGGFREVADTQTNFLMMITILMAIVVLQLPSTTLGAVVQAKALGQSGKHAVAELFEKMGPGNHFFLFFLLVTAEELFARWLFLGVLPKIPFLSGTVAFYVLLLAGNAIWALIHLANFQEQEDRHALRVLPQFVAGFFFSYVFVAYGLVAVILTHFAANAILFSTHKSQRTGIIDGLIVGYGALTAGISYALMSKPLGDIMPWFSETPTFQLEGWATWDYALLSIFISGCIGVVFGLLGYDRGSAGQETHWAMLPFAIPLVHGITYGVYALLAWWLTDSPYLILAIALLTAFIHQSASGSGMARVFWATLPAAYISVCVIQALGIWPVWPALGYMAIITLVAIPGLVLNELDD